MSGSSKSKLKSESGTFKHLSPESSHSSCPPSLPPSSQGSHPPRIPRKSSAARPRTRKRSRLSGHPSAPSAPPRTRCMDTTPVCLSTNSSHPGRVEELVLDCMACLLLDMLPPFSRCCFSLAALHHSGSSSGKSSRNCSMLGCEKEAGGKGAPVSKSSAAHAAATDRSGFFLAWTVVLAALPVARGTCALPRSFRDRAGLLPSSCPRAYECLRP